MRIFLAATFLSVIVGLGYAASRGTNSLASSAKKTCKGHLQMFDPRMSPANNYLSRAQFRAHYGNNRGALDDLSESIRLGPCWLSYLIRGHLHDKLGYPKSAVEDYTEAINQYPDSQCLAMTYLYRGLTRSETGDRNGAMADYAQAIKVDPTDHAPYTARARARLILGGRSGALEDAYEAVKCGGAQPLLQLPQAVYSISPWGNQQERWPLNMR